MSEPSPLDSLLLEYDARRRAGRPCAPEDLVAQAGWPALLEPLRRRLRDLASMEAFLAGAMRPAEYTPPTGPFDPPRSDAPPACLGLPEGGRSCPATTVCSGWAGAASATSGGPG